MRKILVLLCPPIVLKVLFKLKRLIKKGEDNKEKEVILDSSTQDLDLYWDSEYAKVLEEWGKDSTWNEIQLLLSPCKGKVLDIACGTGITIDILKQYTELEIHGFDISDLLIQKAIEKEIPKRKIESS